MTISRRWVAGLATALALSSTAAGCGGKPKKAPTGTKKPAGPTGREILEQARAAAAAGDIQGADAKYREAYAAVPDDTILEEHVTFLYEHKQVESAVELAKANYDAHPTDAKASHIYAQALLAAGDVAVAIQVADELLVLDENDAAAHEKKGRGLILAGQLEPGIEELRKAVAIDPKNPQFQVELGSGLHRAGKVDEAALTLRTAITLDPDNGRALMLLGLALADQSELEEAEVFLNQATKKTKDARPWFELGIVQNKRGDDLGAENSLSRAVELEPESALYQYAYGEMLRFNKKYDAAIDAYRKATEAEPPHPKAAAKLGLALFEAQRLGEAEVFLTDAIRKDAKNPYNYYNLAIVYRQQKKTKLAIEMYEKFLVVSDKSDGDRPRAEACIKNLKKKKPCT